MWAYGLLLIAVFILLIVFVIYVVRLSHKVISKYVENNNVSWILSFLPLLFFVIGFFIDPVNAIVVDIHLILIVSFVKLLFFIVNKIVHKEVNEYLVLGIGVLMCTLILGHGYYLAHHVIETDYTVYTTKDIGTDKFRIVQISDSHLGTTMNGKEFSKYMEDINKLNPDVVVVTGDFVDDDSSLKDMTDGAIGLGKLKSKYGVYFIYGNHDKGYYNNRSYTDSDIRKELKDNNVTILEDRFLDITDNVVLVGRQDAEVVTRSSADALTKNINKDKYIIMLNHQPTDYEHEKDAADLILLGHTHGGQLFPLGQISVLLGVNDAYSGLEKRGNATFIINTGISDWAIKFKTGTVAEYTVIDIKKE